MRSILAIPVLWTALAATAAGRDIYVNNVNGDDRNSGETAVAQGLAGGPYRTIARALRAADNGDRIILAATAEPYRESLSFGGARNSGEEGRPFVFDGNGAVLDGTASVPLDAWEHYQGNVFRFTPDYGAFQQLYLDGKPAARVAPRESSVAPPELQPLQWSLAGGKIYFCAEKDRLPHQYDLTYAAQHCGVTLYQVRHFELRNLVVQGFQLDGVNAHDGVRETALVGLTCRGNGRSGISVGGASQVTVAACLAGDNGAAQVRGEGWSATEIVNCNLLDNTAPAVVRDSPHARVDKVIQQ